jgi:branched-chain amino acid aminotransferase
MEGSISIDGKLLAPDDARVSVFDRGFLYGDGAFEVMRTYSGRPFRESDHLERLRDSCERLLLPVKSGPEQWSATIARTIEASGLPECYVRFMITRGVAPMGLHLGEAQNPSELCFALPLRPYPDELYARGVAIGLTQATRAADGTRAAGAKTSNYLASVLALHEVQQRGCHEAIILGPHGEVVEGASSNIFILRDYEVYTPPIEAGILPGITRKVVIELAQLLGFKVNETQVLPSDLYKADEVFITSTMREIMPVVRVDDVTIPPGRPGMTTQMMINAFRAVAARPPEPAGAAH